MKISLIQTDLQWEVAADNLKHIEQTILNATQADLFLLPEMFTTGFVVKPERVAEEAQTTTLDWMRKIAGLKKAAVAGSVAVVEEGKYLNRFYFVMPDGNFYSYDKRHLFRMGGENEHYSSGSKRVLFEYMGLRIRPLICYDLRFPVWSRAQNDCDLMLYVASWPTSRIGVWDTLLRARAIENQCYVAGVNRVGADPGNDYCGNSAIINYIGESLAQTEAGKEDVITSDISLEALNVFRKQFPVWMDADKFDIV